MMRSVYSVGVRLGRGIGLTALNAAKGLNRAGILARLLVGARDHETFPMTDIRSLGIVHRAVKKLAYYEPSGQATDWTDAMFDTWAQRHVPACDVFHGWGNMCLRQLRIAHQLGAQTIVERASAHTLTQARLLAEEADRWGIKQPLTVQSAVQRGVAENEETDFVVVPSQFVYDSFLAHGMTPRQIILNPFGVDTKRFAPPAVKRAGPFRAVFVGQVGVRKGVPDLLDAWKRAAIPHAELQIVGQFSPEIAPLLARYRGLDGVTYMGHQDPAELYRDADVFIFLSVEEGSALVTYEAMASGIPIIVTPHCGSVARDGEDGFIVPIRDPERAAEKLVQLAESAKLRLAMGTAARKHVEQYTWTRYGERLAEAHRQIAQGAGPDGPDWLTHSSSEHSDLVTA